MKTSMFLAWTFSFTLYCVAQLVSPNGSSRKDLIQEFVKMELSGKRLTLAGTSEISTFFVEPKPYSPPKIIFVVSDRFEVEELPPEGNVSKVSVFFHEYYGTLDDAMRFTPAPKTAPGGGLLKRGISADFELVKVEKSERPAHRWKISNLKQAGPTVDLSSAMNYVKSFRRHTADSNIRQNADQALKMLTNLH